MIKNSSSLLPVYARAQEHFVRGEGAYLFDDKGDSYLDFTSGIAVNVLGHANPELTEALTTQAKKLWHRSNLFSSPEQEALARALTEISFADLVFFANSGAEAIECALKMARAYHYEHGDKGRGDKERTEIISFEGCFHGRTLGALAASGKTEGFGQAFAGFRQVPLEDEAAFKAAVSEKTAAVLIEPIQGEGGVRIVSEVFLDFLRKACDETGALLIFDEVQTGVGRTGRFFCYEDFGWSPDILTLAKGLAGGFPIGACLAKAEAARGLTQGKHGSTFGGNPMAMMVALKVVEIVSEPEFLAHVRRLGLALTQKLAVLSSMFPDVIGEWRGQGLLYGFTCLKGAKLFVEEARRHQLLLLTAQHEIVRLAPPLNITEAHLTELAEKLEAVCATLSQYKQGALIDALDKPPPKRIVKK